MFSELRQFIYFMIIHNVPRGASFAMTGENGTPKMKNSQGATRLPQAAMIKVETRNHETCRLIKAISRRYSHNLGVLKGETRHQHETRRTKTKRRKAKPVGGLRVVFFSSRQNDTGAL